MQRNSVGGTGKPTAQASADIAQAASTRDPMRAGDDNAVSMAREWIAQHGWGQGSSEAHTAAYISYFKVVSLDTATRATLPNFDRYRLR